MGIGGGSGGAGGNGGNGGNGTPNKKEIDGFNNGVGGNGGNGGNGGSDSGTVTVTGGTIISKSANKSAFGGGLGGKGGLSGSAGTGGPNRASAGLPGADGSQVDNGLLTLPSAYMWWSNTTDSDPGGLGQVYSTFEGGTSFENQATFRFVKIKTYEE
jgi:hypothetical protein